MVKRKSADVPGNAMGSAANRELFLAQVGQGWLKFLGECQRLEEAGVFISGLSLRGQPGSGDALLVVLRAETEDGKKVAFHSVDEDMTLWNSLTNRIAHNRIEWKVDEYAD